MPTVLSVTRLPENRSGGDDDTFRRQYTEQWHVLFSTYTDVDAAHALYAAGLPLPYDSYSGVGIQDLGAKAKRRRAVQMGDNPYLWLVTIEYDSFSSDPNIATQSGGSSSETPNENPLMDPPRISFGAIHDSIVQERSFDVNLFNERKSIVNSARQQFSPRPTVDAHRANMTYVRNEGTADLHQDFWDKINNTLFAGFFARTLKLNYVTATTEYRNGYQFWQKTYYFESRLPDWDHHILDKGTKVLNADGNPVPFVKAGINSEVLLDGSGHETTNDANGVPRPTILNFKAYDTAEFSDLNLPGL